MNDPIVSPWLVYLIMQTEVVNGVLGGVAVLIGIFVFGLGMATIINLDMSRTAHQESNKDSALKSLEWLTPLLKKTIAVALLVGSLAVFMPSQKSIIAMIAAKHITPQTVEQGIDVVKKVKDEAKADVMELIKALTQESTQVEKETP